MSGTHGNRTLTCPVCGCRYRYTNFMKRTGPSLPKMPDGRVLTDTHQIACFKGRKTQTTGDPERKAG